MLLKNGYVLNEGFSFAIKDLCFSSYIGEKGGSDVIDVAGCYVPSGFWMWDALARDMTLTFWY